MIGAICTFIIWSTRPQVSSKYVVPTSVISHTILSLSLLLDCVLAEPKHLHGVTHQSKARDDSANHFGHRFTLDVSKSWHSDAELIPTPMLLLLEVYGVNMWNRQKSVGYGFTHVPLTPGRYSVTVPTWRPHVSETSFQLKEYFLGLAPQIENIKYAGLYNNEV